ncbi:hypothetical protein Patl1_17927 [Pistacia atlantica]|uniref:Uncharacterized protein n=1 Tax=Pistacia atlantica TaxID=434234 RepID=A0ACC1C1Z6_9ROSI|nr:hypothetical protein Patl1_17927 [Pistacia atlantica]
MFALETYFELMLNASSRVIPQVEPLPLSKFDPINGYNWL